MKKAGSSDGRMLLVLLINNLNTPYNYKLQTTHAVLTNIMIISHTVYMHTYITYIYQIESNPTNNSRVLTLKLSSCLITQTATKVMYF